MAENVIFKMAAAAILNLLPVSIFVSCRLTVFRCWPWMFP